MNSEALKTLQAPLKDRYRGDPEAAVITLSARGRLDAQEIACNVETGRALAKAGLHPATGGDGLALCSGDMLLEALVACAGVTLKAVATALDLKLEDGVVVADGVLDFRGTLGVDKAAPVGFSSITLRFELKGELSEEERATLLKLTERYCVVLQTLKGNPVIDTTLTVAA